MFDTFLTPVGKIDDTDTTHSNETSVPQKPKEILSLSKEGFDHYTSKGTIDQINQILAERELLDSQKTGLEMTLKELKTKDGSK